MKNNSWRSLVLTLSCFFVLGGLAVSAQEAREGVVYWEEFPTNPPSAGSFIHPGSAAEKMASCGDGVQADGELCFSAPSAISVLSGPISGLDVGHLSAGSNLDFVVCQGQTDRMASLFGTSIGFFYNKQIRTMGDGPTDIKMGDFNNDGITDIMATNQNKDRVRIRWGHNTWQSWSFYKTGAGPTKLAVGDLNGDGRDDFVTANTGDDTITIGIKRSGSGFRLTTLYAGDGNSTVTLADMNNDGDLDILHDGAGRLRLRLNDGNGSFFSSTTLVTLPSSNVSFPSITAADVDGDGYRDIVANYGYEGLVLVRRTGWGQYRSPEFEDLDTGALFYVQLHDMDGDDNLDIVTNVVTTLGHNQVNIYLGNGDGTFSSGNIISTEGLLEFEVADFNKDGVLDILHTGHGTHVLLANP